jgi:AAA ATPase domain
MTDNLNINLAFQPGRALREEYKQQFVGREVEIKKGLIGLHNDGAAVAIIGERGIGKTSLACRLMEVLEGDYSFLDSRGIKTSIPLHKYNCIWIECTRQLQNVEGLIIQLLTQSNRHDDYISNITVPSIFNEILLASRTNERLSSILGDKNNEILNNLPTSEVNTELENVLSSLTAEGKRRIHSLFKEVLEVINREYPDIKLAIFIDELDRIPLKHGLADLIKSGNNAQFILIGVADSLNEIVIDHLSVERKFLSGAILDIGRLALEDVDTFFNNSEQTLASRNVTFTKGFREKVFSYSDGFPFMVQLLGKNALEIKLSQFDTIENESLEIGYQEFSLALEEIKKQDLGTNNRLNKLYKYVNNSGKESLLYLIADKQGSVTERQVLEEIPSNYRLLNNISELNEAEIIKSQGKKIRFIDPIMRAIVKDLKESQEKIYDKTRKSIN